MIDNGNKKDLHFNWNLKILLKYILLGFINVTRNFKLILFSLIYITVCTIIWLNRHIIFKTDILIFKKPLDFLVSTVLLILFALVFLAFIFFTGKPIGAKRINNNLHRIGFINSSGEAPMLISNKKLNQSSDIIVLTFETCGIPLSEWLDNQEKIESALNIRIDCAEQGQDCQHIIIHCVDGRNNLPNKLEWQQTLLSEKSFELLLGESLTNKVTVDLAKIPHILIGGSTGSGKSVLLKLLLMQCVKKGAEVYIADFKGGVDFPPVWHEKCEIITEPDELTEILETIVSELKHRKILLKESACPNIDEYNKITDKRLNRIILACDEIAEVLDKTGLSKEEKAVVQKAENLLSVIARQGRAFGIHLILATQRPDANILSGQIKNNIDYRVCGRADNILSQIILDKADANDRVPKNAQGRFLDNHDVLFQAYWFDERRW